MLWRRTPPWRSPMLPCAGASPRPTCCTARWLAERRGRPGSRLAAKVVERANPLAESWFESMSRWWLLEAGLPTPQLQAGFTDGRSTAWVDMWFAEHRTVGEADGAGKYAETGALYAEKQREDWLRDTHRVVARFRRAFARRS